MMVISLLLVICNVVAVPAKKGIWRKLLLTNGKEVKAQLAGDEWFHYYVDRKGNAYMEADNNKYNKVKPEDLEKLRQSAISKRTNNHRNVVYATIEGLKKMQTIEHVAAKRGKKVEEIL